MPFRAAIVWSWAVALVMIASVVAPRGALANTTAPTKKIPVIAVGGSVAERAHPLDLFGDGSPTLREYVSAIRRAAEDDSVPAVVIRFENPSWSLSQAMEVHDAMRAVRDAKKKIYASYDMAGLGNYVASTAADEIVLPPVGGLDIYGINLSVYYMRDLLGKLGVQADAVNTGRFKDAMDPFLRQDMADGTREQLTALVEDSLESMTETVARNRGITEVQARTLLTEGPYTSTQALAAGAVDRLANLDELLDELKTTHSAELDYEYASSKKSSAQNPSLMSLFSGSLSRAAGRKDETPKVALVYAIGSIVDGRTDKSNPLLEREEIASDDFLDVLDDVAKEGGLKAIVLRVDSPGGSAIASDRIWARLRRIQESGIPVVVSMGSVAASGGYYISMGADRIVAQPTTITGSIGVVGGKFVIGGTYEKLGIAREEISIGKNVGLMNETTPWNPAEKKLLIVMLDEIYDTFTAKAATGRKTTQERIKELGGGRVWSGRSALKNGLVDQLGGLQDAIEVARVLGKAPDAKIVEFPKPLTLQALIEKALSGKIAAGNGRLSTRAALARQPIAQAAAVLLPPGAMAQVLAFVEGLGQGTPKVMLTMPMVLEIR